MKTIFKLMLSLMLSMFIGGAIAAATGLNPAAVVGVVIALSMLPFAPVGSVMVTAATITVSEIVSEFGTYLGTAQQQILKLLTQPTFSQQYMTTIASKDLEYRMAKAVIDDIVQGFQRAWTPKGTPAFTPRSIPQRRHKIDLQFYPDEVVDSWLGFLTTEDVDRKTWPITRYIMEQLVIPKVTDNRELKLIGKGDYASPSDGSAQATGLSMDGFCTILEDLKDDGGSAVNFIELEKLTTTNIFDQIEYFASQVAPLYQDLSMNVFVSRSLFSYYMKRRRDLHGQDTNYNGFSSLLEGTNMTLVALPSMAGKDIIFATPKENFIRLINRNDGASNIAVENVDRLVKVYADWYEAVGFGIEEAVFASVPDAEDSGSL